MKTNNLAQLGKFTAILGVLLLSILPAFVIKGFVATILMGMQPFASPEMALVLGSPWMPITLVAGIVCLLFSIWICNYKHPWLFWVLLVASLSGLAVVPIGLGISACLLTLLLFTRKSFFSTTLWES